MLTHLCYHLILPHPQTSLAGGHIQDSSPADRYKLWSPQIYFIHWLSPLELGAHSTLKFNQDGEAFANKHE